MTQINLLPWREELKKSKIKAFITLFSAAVLITIAAGIAYHFYLTQLINQQDVRNLYLESVIKDLKTEFNKLQEKQKGIDLLEAELRYLFSLRESGFQAVRLLDHLPRVTPDEVLLSTLTRNENNATIYGVAMSTLQVTQFMKNIVESDIFKQPELNEISTKKNKTGEERYFQLNITQPTMLEDTYGKI